jgi:hypothetical protein
MNLCGAAVSWIVLSFAVRSCNLLDRSGFFCIPLHSSALSWIALWVPGRTCITRRTDRTKRFKKNGRGKKELARLRILLVSKTDNPHVSPRTSSNDERRAEWWKLISLIRPRDAYPHFLANKAEVEALLRAGHTMHRVWEAYRQASPPFPATYETFRTYCVKHGLSKLRSGPILGPPDVGRTEAAPPSTTAPPSTKARPSPKVWPRIPGKPREFIPRTEDER